jgi:hypothetical protein
MIAAFQSATGFRPQELALDDMIARVAAAGSRAPQLSASALEQVCRGIITGEGPTTAGRVHFSRVIDAEDASLCARILILAGGSGIPVSRAEVDLLFAIDAVGSERRDDGRFDDLLAKAVVHHVMSACGAKIPSRESALSSVRPMKTWAFPIDLNAEIRLWLQSRLCAMTRSCAAKRDIATAIAATEQSEFSAGPVFDMAA